MTPSLSVARRYDALMEVGALAVALPTSAEIFRGFCSIARNVMPFDRAGLMLYDPERDVLKITGLSGSLPGSFFRIGAELNPQHTPHGIAFHRQRAVLRADIRAEAEFDIEKLSIAEGLRSYCAIPLVVRGTSLGVVTILRHRKRAYTEEHAKFLQEMTNPVALALASLQPVCGKHPKSKLICPRCIASAGGLRTASKYRDQLSEWGRQGGRGRKRTSPVPQHLKSQ